MTDAERARLERASKHPLYADAMKRAPQDYALPVALLAGFYLVIPLLFGLWMAAALAATDVPAADAFFLAGMTLGVALPVVPFLIGVTRTWPLRRLPPRHVFGMISQRLTRTPGHWVCIESLDGGTTDLRLRLKAYLESTGGAVGPGSFGVALCKGDQMVEWVDIPDVVPEDAAN